MPGRVGSTQQPPTPVLGAVSREVPPPPGAEAPAGPLCAQHPGLEGVGTGGARVRHACSQGLSLHGAPTGCRAPPNPCTYFLIDLHRTPRREALACPVYRRGKLRQTRSHALKTRRKAPNGVAFAKAQGAEPRPSFSSPRSGLLIQCRGCPRPGQVAGSRPCHAPREAAGRMGSLSLPPHPPTKLCHSCSPGELPSLCGSASHPPDPRLALRGLLRVFLCVTWSFNKRHDVEWRIRPRAACVQSPPQGLWVPRCPQRTLHRPLGAGAARAPSYCPGGLGPARDAWGTRATPQVTHSRGHWMRRALQGRAPWGAPQALRCPGLNRGPGSPHPASLPAPQVSS